MATETENIYIKMQVDTTQFNSSMTGIKKEMASLRGLIGNNLLSKEDNAKLSARFGYLKDQMEDLKKASGNINTQDVFGNMARLGGIAASSVGSVVGMTSLLGVETKKADAIQKQMLTTINIAATLQQIADLKREKGLLREYALMIKKALMFKGETVLKLQSAAATETMTVAEAMNTKGVGMATKAQLVWNAAMAASPIGWIIAGIVALVAIIYVLNKAWTDSTEAIKAYNTQVEESNKITEEYVKAIGEDAVTASRDLAVATGEMTQAQRDLLDITDEYAKKKEDFTKKELVEAQKIITASKLVDDEIRKNAMKRLVYVNGVAINAKQVEEEITNNLKANLLKRITDMNNFWTNYRKGITLLNQSEKDEKGVTSENDKKANEEKLKSFLENQKKSKESTKELNAKLLDDTKKLNLETESIFTDKWAQNYIDSLKNIDDAYKNNIISLERYIELIDENLTGRNRMVKDRTQILIETEKLNTDKRLKDLKKEYETRLEENKKYGIKSDTLTINYENNKAAIQKKSSDLIQKIIEESSKEGFKNIEEYEKLKVDAQKKNNEKIIKYNEERINLNKLLYEKEARDISNIEGEARTQTLLSMEEAIAEQYAALERNKNMTIKSYEDEINKIKEQKNLLFDLGQPSDFLDIDITTIENKIAAIKADFEMAGEDITQAWKDFLATLSTPTLTEQWKMDWDKIMNSDDLGAKIAKWTEMFNIGFNAIVEGVNMALSTASANLATQTENDIKKVKEAMDQTMTDLDRALKYGIISQETYDRQKLAAEETAAAKEKDLKTKQAKQEKEWNIARAIMAAIQSVSQALATPPPMSYVMAAVNTALGIAQVASIKNVDLPEFATGGPIYGASHSQGGVPIVAEGGEYVIKNSVAQRPGMGNFLDKVNSGQIGVTTINNSLDVSTIETIVKSTIAGVASIPVINVESSSTRVQRKVSNIETKSSW